MVAKDKSNAVTYCMKVDEKMLELIDWLEKQEKIFSRSEFIRFALKVYLYDAINPLYYIWKYFPAEYNDRPRGKPRNFFDIGARKQLSARIQLPLIKELDRLVEEYKKDKFNRSAVVRQAIDNAIPYFTNLSDLKQLTFPILR